MPSKQNHTCSVIGCHPPRGVSYHRYPIRDRNLHIKWLRLTARYATELSNNSRICQIHFKPEDFQQNTERRWVLFVILRFMVSGNIWKIHCYTGNLRSPDKELMMSKFQGSFLQRKISHCIAQNISNLKQP